MPTLDWLNRDDAFRIAQRVPTRVLRPHPAGGEFGDAASGNLLVQGDNLDALKALLPFYRGRVKCIFIDPPYNTQSAFEHYDDKLEHSQWLTMMLPRLQLLRELLSEDGSIWVTIDDNEGHYLKVLMDEVFGRGNFIANLIWEKRTSRENRRVLSFKHDHLLAYSRTQAAFEATRNALPLNQTVLARYKNPDNDLRGPWQSVSANAQAGHATASQFYRLRLPSGRLVDPPKGRCWLYTQSRMEEEIGAGNIWFGTGGDNAPRVKKFLRESEDKGLTPETIWYSSDVSTNDEAKKSILQLLPDSTVFDNPKPEALLSRVVHIATNPNDLVLDSFLGSGTTAAVAHKMGRRWIGIEAGEHAVTHCLPRLRKVVEGEQGGISAAVNWQGGGGFRFVQLGAPMFDADGEIDADVRFADLAAFIWMRETGNPLEARAAKTGLPLIGTHAVEPGSEATAYYLLFNGILGDRRPAGGNVLTSAVLDALRATCWHAGAKVVYGEACRLGDSRLADERITFRQLPHAVRR
ncbi:MAG: site-specific DNA-methyltransferase [Pseudomonadota bacterium]